MCASVSLCVCMHASRLIYDLQRYKIKHSTILESIKITDLVEKMLADKMDYKCLSIGKRYLYHNNSRRISKRRDRDRFLMLYEYCKGNKTILTASIETLKM